MATDDTPARVVSGVRMVPQQVQLRLDEPSDGELLALIQACQQPDDEAAFNARCDLKDLYRSLPRPLDLAVMDRVRALRAQVRAERTPP